MFFNVNIIFNCKLNLYYIFLKCGRGGRDGVKEKIGIFFFIKFGRERLGIRY